MRKLLFILVMAVLGAACSGDDGTATGTPTPGASEVTGGTGTTGATPTGAPAAAGTLTATLSGAEEVPGPGAEGATGNATIRVEAGQLCAAITTDVAAPTAAHIHEGAAGASGGVVVDLSDALGGTESCVPADQAAIDAIVAGPDGYYVNVHNAEFPDGAARGQLAAG